MNHQSDSHLNQSERGTVQALSSPTRAILQALHVPAACLKQNMMLVQDRAQAYSDFARSCADSRKFEDIANAYAGFGNQMMTDYVNYCQGIAGAMMGSLPDGKWQDH